MIDKIKEVIKRDKIAERLSMVLNFILSFEWVIVGSFMVACLVFLLLFANILGWACG